jgi:pyruvate dehydrogenase complex dehydrogenase (E1) component
MPDDDLVVEPRGHDPHKIYGARVAMKHQGQPTVIPPRPSAGMGRAAKVRTSPIAEEDGHL